MDVHDLIEEPSLSEKIMRETKEITKSLTTQGLEIFEEESVTLHHMAYNRSSKKLLIEKVNTKNKKLFEKWTSTIDFHGVTPSTIVQFHEETGEALKEFVGNIERENLELKLKIKELEATLIPKPLFVDPLNIAQPTLTLEYIPKSSNKWKGSYSLLLVVR